MKPNIEYVEGRKMSGGKQISEQEALPKASVRGWVFAIVFSFFIAVFSMMMIYFAPWPYVESVSGAAGHPPEWRQWFIRGLFLVIVPMLILSYIPKKVHKLSSRDLALIYIGVILAFAFTGATTRHEHSTIATGLQGIFYELADHILRRGYDQESMISAYAPFVPQLEDIRDMWHYDLQRRTKLRSITEPVSIDWGAFLPPALNFFFFTSIDVLALMLLACLIKRQYIDEEHLPFPNTMMILQCIRSASGEEAPNVFKSVWFGAGVLLGIVLKLPDWIYMAFPYDVILYNQLRVFNLILPMIPIGISIFQPATIGLSLMIPIQVMISFFITWFVFDVIIVNAVAPFVGITIEPGTTMNTYHSIAVGDIAGPNAGGLIWTVLGAVIAVALWPIIRNYRGWVASFKAIFKPDPELDARSPLPHRWLWVGLIVLLVLEIAYFAALGAWIHALLFALPFYLLIHIAWMRTVGEAGAYNGMPGGFSGEFSDVLDNSAITGWGRSFVKATVGDPSVYAPEVGFKGTSRRHFMTFLAPIWGQNNFLPKDRMPTGYLLEAFVIAEAVNLRSRDILKMAIIVALFTLLVCPLIPIWQAATWTVPNYLEVGYAEAYRHFGVPHMAQINSYYYPRAWRGFWYESYGSNEVDLQVHTTLLWFFPGLIGSLLIYFIRSKFPSFIYNPVAMILWIMPQPLSDIWFPMLLALVIKYVAIRYKGAKFFEENLIPMALGMIFASGLCYAVQSLMMVYVSLTTAPT
ncbi:MAG: hypothetical protein DRJ38_03290 [Thermoprotei archaeon]|nr:MAG: hypothetical protein DRJ38_03290 [Thermoprotei archaeon]